MKANDISLYDLVGKRFNTLDQLKMAIEKIGNMKVDMIAESQTERPEDSDDMIDFCYLELQEIVNITSIVPVNADHQVSGLILIPL